jgi:hypothetical protein
VSVTQSSSVSVTPSSSVTGTQSGSTSRTPSSSVSGTQTSSTSITPSSSVTGTQSSSMSITPSSSVSELPTLPLNIASSTPSSNVVPVINEPSMSPKIVIFSSSSPTNTNVERPTPSISITFTSNLVNSSINNLTNQTDISSGTIDLLEINRNQEANPSSSSILSSPSFIGGIGAGLAIVLLIVGAAVYILTKKAKTKNKRKEKEDNVAEVKAISSELVNEEPLFEKLNNTRKPLEPKNNVLRFSSESQEGSVRNLNSLNTKHIYSPTSAGNPLKNIQRLDLHKDISKAEPLTMYKAISNTVGDRLSLKRGKHAFRAPNVENKVTFNPIKKEWKPQLAREDQNIRVHKSDDDYLHISFDK